MDIQALIITSVVGLISAIVGSGVFALIAQRKVTAAKVITEEETAKKVKAETEKIRSEAAQIIQDSSGDLVMEYKRQLQEMKEERDRDKKQYEEERVKDKKRFEEELSSIKKQLTDRINKLEDELTEAYIKIDQQDLIIAGLNSKIAELSM